jgi:transcriptional regulator with XRE-family HTH domain
MGRKRRERPSRLAEKLRQIRERLGLSQSEMARRLTPTNKLTKSEVSAFERGTHEPNLLVLLAYSEAANIFFEALVRDDLDIPSRLPSKNNHGGVKRKLS